MRVDELVHSLVRRPVGLILVVLIAAGGATYGWKSASTSYESNATVLIIPPPGTDDSQRVNPLVNLDYSITQLALTVSSQLQADQVKDAVEAVGGSRAYTSDTLSSDNSAVAQLTPMVALTATAPTPSAARNAATVLVQQASTQLAAIQDAADVPAAARASVVVSAEPSAGAAVGSAKLRAAGVLGIASGFAALLGLIALQPVLGSSPGQGRGHHTVPKSAVRALLQEEWDRSGRNVPLTRREAREAWRNAENRLAAAGHHAPREIEVSIDRLRGRRG